MTRFESAKESYARFGVDVEKALELFGTLLDEMEALMEA